MDEAKNTENEFEEIKHKMMHHHMGITKYNYTVDLEADSKMDSYKGEMGISHNGKRLVVHVFRPQQNKDFKPELVAREEEEESEESKEESHECMDHGVDEHEHHHHEEEVCHTDVAYDQFGKKMKKFQIPRERVIFRKTDSKASINLSEITGFVYGGISSRFWMLRKHVNSLYIEVGQKLKLPFYSWQCVTL